MKTTTQLNATAHSNPGQPIGRLLKTIILLVGAVCLARVGLCQTPIACGQTVTGKTMTGSQMDQYSYAASAGQLLIVALNSGDDCCGNRFIQADIYDPNGQLWKSITPGGPPSISVSPTLTGTYSILVHSPAYNDLGSYSLSVQRVTAGGCGGMSLACGQTVSGRTTDPTQMKPYALVASAGELLIVALNSGDDCCGNRFIQADIYDPNGQLWRSVNNVNNQVSTNVTVSLAGMYTVLVHSPAYNDTGSYSLTETVLSGCSALPTVSAAVQPVSLGSDATFTSTANGPTPLFYERWVGGNRLTGWTSSNTYTLTNVQAGQLGIYKVVVSNPGGAVTNSARL